MTTLNLAPLRELLDAAYTEGNTDGHREQSGTAAWGYSVTEEELYAAIRLALAPALVLEPCHVTGIHDPSHTPRYVCSFQTNEIANQVLAALGLTVAELPHRLHPEGPHSEGGCYWCHHVPDDENNREKNRELHRWAGEPIPAELAEPAVDAPRDGDDDLVASVLSTDEAITWAEVDRRLEATLGAPFNTTRRALALRKLQMDCRTEEYRPSAGATERLLTPEQTEAKRAQRDEDAELTS